MYDKISQIFSPMNPSHLPNQGYQGDMMLPFVNQKIVSVSKELKARQAQENNDLDISSQLTLGFDGSGQDFYMQHYM